MSNHLHRTRYASRRSERGQALLLLLAVLGLASGMLVFSMVIDVSRTAASANTNALALADTKAALIGWAASRGDTVGNARPGRARPMENPVDARAERRLGRDVMVRGRRAIQTLQREHDTDHQ